MARNTRLVRSVAGKVVFITGAASGMGRATALLFADEGAHVAAADREPSVAAVAEQITAAGLSGRAWTLDVSDRGAVERTVAAAARAFGGLDILVNNAGIPGAAAIDGDDFEAAWQRTLEVNLFAYTYTIRAALPYLRRSESPRIINIASTEGLGAMAGMSPYTTSKHGVVGLTRSLAMELGREGITVNCICPGPIVTGMTDAIPEADRDRWARRRTALGRYGDPEEVAHMTLSLAMPAASYVTGVALPVDGGQTIRRG